MNDPAPRSSARATVVGGAATVVCVLPVFLTGAMAVQLTGELGFGAAAFGVAVGIYRASAGVTSILFGGVVDRRGAIWSLRVALVVSIVASIGIATTAVNWISLVGWLMVAGWANALGQPAANRLLTNAVKPGRLGLAFGIKQSAVPAASVLAGMAVPAVALTVGWRWAYALGAVLAVVVIFAAGRRTPAARLRLREQVVPRLNNPNTAILALAFGLSTAASSTVTVFYVDAAVSAGSSLDFAGVMLAVGSFAAILVRLVMGVVCDRVAAGHLRLCAALVGSGSIGLALLAIGSQAAMTAGILIVMSGLWGFNGAFWYALVRGHPDSPSTLR